MTIRNWSTTASSNNAAPPNGWPEGQSPSSVNNVGRQMMADIRETIEALPFFDYGHTPTRIDNDTFTVATDLTAMYVAGRRVKLVGVTTGYATIASSSYSAPDTTVNVTMDSGNVPTSLSTVSLGSDTTLGAVVPYFHITAAEKSNGISSVNTLYPELTYERYGCDPSGLTDCAAEVQVAVGYLLEVGGTLSPAQPGAIYRCDSPVTYLRDSALQTKIAALDFGGVIFDFSHGTYTDDYRADEQTNLFNIGSVPNLADLANPSYIVEVGSLVVRGLQILGPEPTPPFSAPNPGVDVPQTGTVGLRLQLALNVLLEDIQVTNCVVGVETKDSWDVKASHVRVRNSWVAFSIMGGSTYATWDHCGATQCCYPAIFRSWAKPAAPTYGSYAAVSAQNFSNFRTENCWFGPVLYPVDTAIRGVRFECGYAEDILYDWCVSGFTWDQSQMDDPESLMTIATGPLVDRLDMDLASRGATIGVGREIFRAPTGASINNVHCHLILPRLAGDLSAGFKSSYVMMLGNDTEGAGSIYMYDASGNLTIRQLMGGSIMLGAGKNTALTISETGTEIRADGSVYLTREADAALRINRKTDTGPVLVCYQASNVVGSITALADKLSIALNDAGVVFTTYAGSPENNVTGAPGSICTDLTNGVIYSKKTGSGNTGWKLVTQAA